MGSSAYYCFVLCLACIFWDRFVARTNANHATRTFDRPSTKHPEFPYPDDFANDLVKDLQKMAEQTAQDLIVTDDFNTAVSTGSYSDIGFHGKSLNTYQHTLAKQNTRTDSNFGHLPDAYAHFRLWDDRNTPASGEDGILDYPREVPHRWAYKMGSEGTTPCEVTPFEQGRCVIYLPYVVQQKSGDIVEFVAGINKIEARSLAEYNGVWYGPE
jgi:hypothetical protein